MQKIPRPSRFRDFFCKIWTLILSRRLWNKGYVGLVTSCRLRQQLRSPHRQHCRLPSFQKNPRQLLLL